MPDWLNDIGVGPVPEFSEDTGIVYASRFYRLKPGHTYPPRLGPIGGGDHSADEWIDATSVAARIEAVRLLCRG